MPVDQNITITSEVEQIDRNHDQIHRGNWYSASYIFNGTWTASATIFEIRFTTGAKTVHLKPRIFNSDYSQVSVISYESPTISNRGTALIVPKNQNRNSSNTSTVQIASDVSGVSGGTTMGLSYIPGAASYVFGTSTTDGGTFELNAERLLKPNTDYVWVITNSSSNSYSNTNFQIKWNWYEI